MSWIPVHTFLARLFLVTLYFNAMNMKTSYNNQNKSQEIYFGRHLVVLFFVILVSLAGCIVVPQPAYTPAPTPASPSNYVPPPSNTVASPAGNQVNFQLFYDELSPYGSWVDYPIYGYVWIPFVDPGFVPYSTNGHWIYTDAGWTWISDFNWGWAAFHYGRWGFDQQLGWFWVPDYQWGPAWVTWRRGNGYYGWAPMTPGISMSASYSSGYSVPSNYWVFVNERDFGRPDVNSYYVNRSNNVTIINNSTVINNTYVDESRHTTYYTGPQVTEVQNATGRSYNRVLIRESNQPGQTVGDGEVRIYRPVIQQSNTLSRNPAPSRVYTVGEYSSSPRRNASTQQQINNTNTNTATDPNNSSNRRQNTQQQNSNYQNGNNNRNAVQENSNAPARNNPAVTPQQSSQPVQPANNPSISPNRREVTGAPKNTTVTPKQERRAAKNDANKKTDTKDTRKPNDKNDKRRE